MEVQRIPKNIRQIGEIEDWIKVYIEDYVVTYIHRVNVQSRSGKPRWGLLLGKKERTEHSVYLFLSGAMEVTEEETRNSGGWDQIEETIRVRFPGSQIWGWFLCESESQNVSEEWASQMFRKYFDREYQVLYWQREREADFYVSSIRGLERLRGYHIYYERNEEMQEYMILSSPHYRTEPEPGGETVVDNYRKIMQEKRPERKTERKQEKVSKEKTYSTVWKDADRQSGGTGPRPAGSEEKTGMPEGTRQSRQPGRKNYGFFHAASLVCVFLIGIMAFYGRRDMQTSALVESQSAGQTDSGEMEANAAVIEEIPANIQPTEEPAAEETHTEGAESQAPQTETAQTQASQTEMAQTQAPQTETAQTQPSQTEAPQTEAPQTQPPETEAAETQPPQTEAAARPDTYTVQTGDTLQKISIAIYGDDSMMQAICDENDIDDPNYLFAGQVLLLP